MARYTERVQITVAVELKHRLVAKARRQIMSLSAVMRDIVDEMIAEHELEVACAQMELRVDGATIH